MHTPSEGVAAAESLLSLRRTDEADNSHGAESGVVVCLRSAPGTDPEGVRAELVLGVVVPVDLNPNIGLDPKGPRADALSDRPDF